MADYQIAFHLATKHAVIQPDGDVLPANVGGTAYNNIGTFEHGDVEEEITDLEFDVNHVFFQHVRDALYHVNAVSGLAVPNSLQFPDNITDMAGLTISTDVIKNNVSISSTPATVTLAALATQQITTVFTPVDSTNQELTYESSDETKATVSETGLITAVATGEATITVTTVEGAKTDTVVVTVS